MLYIYPATQVALVGAQAARETGRQAGRATIPSRGQKIELVCRWSGVAVLVQALETLLLRWAARRFQTGTSWPAGRDLIGRAHPFSSTQPPSLAGLAFSAQKRVQCGPVLNLAKILWEDRDFPPRSRERLDCKGHKTAKMGKSSTPEASRFNQPFTPDQVDSYHT